MTRLPRITTVADVARTTVLTLIVTMASPVTQRGPPASVRG